MHEHVHAPERFLHLADHRLADVGPNGHRSVLGVAIAQTVAAGLGPFVVPGLRVAVAVAFE